MEWIDGEWQPVRVVPTAAVILAHKGKDLLLISADPRCGKLVRVRPYVPTAEFVEMTRKYGCMATNYFETHPDDVLDSMEGAVYIWCEHQIEAD